MLKKSLPLFFIAIICASNAFSQNLADSGYYYQKLGDKVKAAAFFEEFITANPDNHQVRLDLAYLYRDMNRTDNAREQFEYVSKYSSNNDFVQQANYALSQMQVQQQTVTYLSAGDSGYYYYNQGNKTKAAEFFELHLKQNLSDTKTRLQLAYIYYDQRKLSQSLKHFDYVARHSTKSDEVETARSAAYNIRQELSDDAARSFELYFYNYYDSYQENYIANLVAHVHFKLGKNLYAGPYLDVYTDTRTTRSLVFNDRFVELGGFLRYNIMRNLFFELRLGYTRQIDLDSSQINIKPMLVYFNRFGTSPTYIGRNSKASKTSFYLDVYYAAMYDFKYRNAFLQAALEQVLRFHTGGYGYVDNYLVERVQFDSRKLDYNNYLEVGLGLRFKPNVPVFPVFFVEPTYKAYFFGSVKNSFQLKAGFWFYFKTKI